MNPSHADEPAQPGEESSKKTCSKRLLSESWTKIKSLGGSSRSENPDQDSTIPAKAKSRARVESLSESQSDSSSQSISGIRGTRKENTTEAHSIRQKLAIVPAQCFRPWIDLDRQATVTRTLITINSLVFLVMSLVAGVDSQRRYFDPITPMFKQSSATMITWGANWGPMTLNGDIWRILTCNYLHIGIAHLLVNMVTLWALGSVAERLFGSRKYFLIYTLSGIAGSALSLLFYPAIVSAGASGAIMGICGALTGFAWLKKDEMEAGAAARVLRATIALFVVCVITSEVCGGHNGAHMGGFLAGLAAGAGFAGRAGWGKLTAIALMVAALLCIDMVTPFDVNGKVLLERAARLRWCKLYAQALAACVEGEKRYPRDYAFATEAAKICAAQKDLEGAQRHANLAVMINPNADETLQTRARVLLELHRPDLAIDDLSKLLQKNSEDIDARSLRAYAYRALNEPFLCLEDTHVLRQVDPDSFAWAEMEAYATADSGDVPQAIRMFEALCVKREPTEGMKSSFARVLAQAKRFPEAVSMANRIVDPKTRYRTLTYIYLDKLDLQRAQESAERAMQEDPRDPEIHMAMAAVRWCQARRADAAAEAKKAYDLSPNQSARNRLYYLIFEAISGSPAQQKEAVEQITASLDELDKAPWQALLARYFAGAARGNYILQMASNNNEGTEAHAYIGLWSLKHGYPDAAKPHMAFVMAQGNRGFLEYMMVRSIVAARKEQQK